ncbi:MAG: hypothetical protein ACJA1A_002330 [Saprospiraceae bacterium]|jgi:hypothetical protein
MPDEESVIIQDERTKLTLLNWLFLFVASYFLLYCNVGQFLTAGLFEWIYTLIVPPFASLFGVDNLTRIQYTGSGDTPFHYYQVFLMICVVFVASFFMLFLMRKKRSVQLFEKIVFMLVRYYLIYQMIIYGLSKVFYLQFMYPNDILLERTLGDMSPMGLMWTFMGSSMGYTMFVGWLEFLGGLFLIFRRTMVFGSLMTFGVMLNVFMLNMCYDVPVKLLSLHMVFMSLYLLYPVAKEVGSFFFSRGEVIREKIPFFDYKEATNFMLIIKVGLLIVMMIRMVHGNYSRYQSRIQPHSFTNKHDVTDQKIIKDHIELDSIPDHKKWKTISSMSSKYLCIEYADKHKTWYEMEINEPNKYIDLKRSEETKFKRLYCTTDEFGIKVVTGIFYSDSISVTLLESKRDFLLRSRKFYWMQEYPFNK